MAGVPLAAAIKELRRQITEAIEQAGSEDDLRFRLGPIELEVQVEIEDSQEAKAGVDIWVVSVGAGANLRSTQTHRVTLSLQPHTTGNEEVNVSRKMSGRRAPIAE